MIRTLLLTSMVFVSGQSWANIPFLYYDVYQQISALDIDTMELLDVITAHVNQHGGELEAHERDALVAQLQRVKQRLCVRPGAGILVLPILATYAACFYVFLKAVDVWSTYDLPRWAKEDFAKELFDLEQQYSSNFKNSLLYGAAIMVAAYSIEAEYFWKVDGLFEKERALGCKIDELITLLQQ